MWGEFRRASTAWGTRMVRGDPVTISAGASTKRAVAGMAGRQGGGRGGDIPEPQVQVVGYNALRDSSGARDFGVSAPRAFPSLSHTRREKGN